MLALETMINNRLNNPKCYFIFYEYFYKAAVGEKSWNDCIKDEENGRIGNDNTEAFALLLLTNNYKAWLSDEKQRYRDLLMTEYDTVPNDANPSLVDIVLPNMEITVKNQSTDIDEDTHMILRDSTDQQYQQMSEERKRMLMLGITANHELCDSMKKCWEETETSNHVMGHEEADATGIGTDYGKERRKKRRKLMKGMRKWTCGTEKGAKILKGWSTSGHRAFELFMKEIREDKERGRYQAWERAIREIYEEREQIRLKEYNKRQQKDYHVDKDLVWEL